MAKSPNKPSNAGKAAGKQTDRKKSNMSNEALEALGLDVAPEAPAANTEAVTEAKEHVEREEVDVGEIEIGEIDYIPASKRASGGSKYKFDELAAPVTKDNGKKGYSFFRVTLQPGVDSDKLRRSVASATTQANKQAKDRGHDAYYITRAENGKDGKFQSMLVIRTDDRPTNETE